MALLEAAKAAEAERRLATAKAAAHRQSAAPPPGWMPGRAPGLAQAALAPAPVVRAGGVLAPPPPVGQRRESPAIPVMPPIDLATFESREPRQSPRRPGARAGPVAPDDDLEPAEDGLAGRLPLLGVDERKWLDDQFEWLAAGEAPAPVPAPRAEARAAPVAGARAPARPQRRA